LEAVIANLSKDSAVYHFHYDENLIMPVRLEKVDLPSLEENNDARVNQHETSASRPISVNTQQLERAADSKSKSSISDSGKLEYIVGSFENETNANNLVLTLKNKGIQAEISGKFNGLIRVSAGKATDEQALQKIIQKVNSLGFEGWISK
jgi:cell division septation protein DedD